MANTKSKTTRKPAPKIVKQCIGAKSPPKHKTKAPVPKGKYAPVRRSSRAPSLKQPAPDMGKVRLSKGAKAVLGKAGCEELMSMF